MKFLKVNIATLFVLLIGADLSAQLVIKGTVYNELTNEKIPSVNIIVKNAVDSSIISFAQSNLDGYYELELSSDKVVD